MKTNVITVKNNGAGIADALKEAERFAAYQHLSHKEALRLRLLAEEMMGMVKGIVGEFQAQFWIEGEEREAQLTLEAQAWVDLEKRDQLLAVSSNGKNYAHRTFMGRLAGIFETCMMSYDETAAYALQSADCLGYDMMPGLGYERMWSLGSFRDYVGSGSAAKQDEWDELEKSIVAKLADEVIVGVKSRMVQMIIKKTFRE